GPALVSAPWRVRADTSGRVPTLRREGAVGERTPSYGRVSLEFFSEAERGDDGSNTDRRAGSAVAGDGRGGVRRAGAERRGCGARCTTGRDGVAEHRGAAERVYAADPCAATERDDAKGRDGAEHRRGRADCRRGADQGQRAVQQSTRRLGVRLGPRR